MRTYRLSSSRAVLPLAGVLCAVAAPPVLSIAPSQPSPPLWHRVFDGKINAVSAAADGSLIAVTTEFRDWRQPDPEDSALHVLDWNGAPRWRHAAETDVMRSVAVSPDGDRVVAVDSESIQPDTERQRCRLLLFDADGAPDGVVDGFCSALISPDGRRIAAVRTQTGEPGRIAVFDRDGRLELDLERPGNAPVEQIAWLDATRLLVVDGDAWLYDVLDRQLPRRIESVSGVGVVPDAPRFLAARQSRAPGPRLLIRDDGTVQHTTEAAGGESVSIEMISVNGVVEWSQHVTSLVAGQRAWRVSELSMSEDGETGLVVTAAGDRKVATLVDAAGRRIRELLVPLRAEVSLLPDGERLVLKLAVTTQDQRPAVRLYFVRCSTATVEAWTEVPEPDVFIISLPAADLLLAYRPWEGHVLYAFALE